MPSEYQSAPAIRIQQFPDIAEKISENPARFLDRDVLGTTPAGESKPSLLLEARIRGIDYIDVVDAYLQVELALDREDCPRQGVVALLNQRKQWLREHGERPRGPKTPHDEIPSTESNVVWADTPDGKQRRVARVRK